MIKNKKTVVASNSEVLSEMESLHVYGGTNAPKDDSENIYLICPITNSKCPDCKVNPPTKTDHSCVSTAI